MRVAVITTMGDGAYAARAVQAPVGGKADIFQGKADIKKCPLMTQSGHRRSLPVH